MPPIASADNSQGADMDGSRRRPILDTGGEFSDYGALHPH